MADYATRTIQFYKLNGDLKFNYRDFLGRLSARQAIKPKTPGHEEALTKRKVELSNNNYLLGWCDGAPEDGKLILGKVRTGAFPLLELDGDLKEMDVAANTGLAETAHIMFFDGGLIGVEYNHFGARVSDLIDYLKGLDEAVNIRADALIRSDLMARFRKVSAFSKLVFWVVPSDAARQSRAKQSLISALASCGSSAEQGALVKVEVVPFHGADSLPTAPTTLAHNLAEDMLDQSLELQKLIIEGYEDVTRKGETKRSFNFIKDLLKVKVDIELKGNNSKAIDSTSAFKAIRTAFKENRDDIVNASILGMRPRS